MKVGPKKLAWIDKTMVPRVKEMREAVHDGACA